MGKLTRITWPQEYSELQRIEELLLCGICYDYMDTSVMTPCSHNYCSLCIRKYLHYKTQCPACFEKTFEKDLHTNRILDELILYFGKIRSKLVDCIAGAKIETEEDGETVQDSTRLTPVRPARTNQGQKKTPPKVETKQSEISADVAIKTENLAPLAGIPQKLLSSPSTSGVKVATIFTPRSKKNVASGSTLPCPVCRVDVSEVNINKHLDDCLKRETSTQEPVARTEPQRKPLPKLVFSLMKDTELRKKIKEFGLPTQGDRKTLQARFQRYSTLYNAECDRREPRPVEELLRQCLEEEALEKKMLKISQAATRLKVTRNSEENIIEEAQKKYLESNKKNYQSLIASIKMREKSQKPAASRSSRIIEDADDPSSETSENGPEKNANHPSDDEDLNGASYSVNAYDANFQDSDSDSCCPLQHYTSDDPISFLSIQMSTPGNSKENSLQSPTKPSPFESRVNGENSLDATVLPAKNVTLSNDKCVLMTEGSSRNEAEDIFNAAIDTESNDEESAVTSKVPKVPTSHSTKRAKLSLKKASIADQNANEPKNDQSKLEGKKLALSIARDFSFDTSSNESESEETHETVYMKATEEPKVDARRVEAIKPVLPNVDKENLDSSAASSMTVNRPVRKRNCVTRAQSAKGTKPGDAGVVVPEEAPRTSTDDRENASSATRIDSPVKRRRRRKIETQAAPVAKNPPSRPLRKRNSVVEANAHQRS